MLESATKVMELVSSVKPNEDSAFRDALRTQINEYTHC